MPITRDSAYVDRMLEARWDDPYNLLSQLTYSGGVPSDAMIVRMLEHPDVEVRQKATELAARIPPGLIPHDIVDRQRDLWLSEMIQRDPGNVEMVTEAVSRPNAAGPVLGPVLGKRFWEGLIPLHLRKQVVSHLGWPGLFQYEDRAVLPAPLQPSEAAQAWEATKSMDAEPGLPGNGPKAQRMLLERQKLPKGAYEEAFKSPYTDVANAAKSNTPFPEHKLAFLRSGDPSQAIWAFSGGEGSAATDEMYQEAMDRYGHDFYKRMMAVGGIPNAAIAHKLLAMADTDPVPERRAKVIKNLLGYVEENPQDDELNGAVAAKAYTIPQFGYETKRRAKELLQWSNPDGLGQERLDVPFGTNKLRQLRDTIREKGVEELPPKSLPAGDWKAFRNPKNGNISAAKLDEAIAATPRTGFNVTEGTWDGGQTHTPESSKVFQLNLTNDHIRRMKEAGVYGTFREMYRASNNSGHPVGPGGIGWVRWTGRPGEGIHIDEVQSDFGQSFVKQAKQQAREQGQDEAEAEAEAEKRWPTEHQKKIEEILFQGKHPSEVLQESFQEWLRQPRAETTWGVKKVRDLPKKCTNPKCYSHTDSDIEGGGAPWHERQGLDEGNPNDPPRGAVCGDCGTYVKTHDWDKQERPLSYIGTPIHIWQPESKAQISLARPDEKLPGHFYVGYRDVPKKFGWKPGEYGELPTQSNPEYTASAYKIGDKATTAAGNPTWKDTVRKFEKAEHYSAQAVSILVEDPFGRLLMGLRQQGGWTLPGGHMDGPETTAEAAIREMWEETGLTPLFMEYLGASMCEAGLPVHVYRAVVHDTQATSANDPDHEVEQWRWFPTIPNGLPPEVLANLAHRKNVALEMVGLGPDSDIG